MYACKARPRRRMWPKRRSCWWESFLAGGYRSQTSCYREKQRRSGYIKSSIQLFKFWDERCTLGVEELAKLMQLIIINHVLDVWGSKTSKVIIIINMPWICVHSYTTNVPTFWSLLDAMTKIDFAWGQIVPWPLMNVRLNFSSGEVTNLLCIDFGFKGSTDMLRNFNAKCSVQDAAKSLRK